MVSQTMHFRTYEIVPTDTFNKYTEIEVFSSREEILSHCGSSQKMHHVYLFLSSLSESYLGSYVNID